MISLARNLDHPPCSACVRDEIYDRTGRHTAAAVRVSICREPYVLRLCERHLAQLTRALPSGGVQIVGRYGLIGNDADGLHGSGLDTA